MNLQQRMMHDHAESLAAFRLHNTFCTEVTYEDMLKRETELIYSSNFSFEDFFYGVENGEG